MRAEHRAATVATSCTDTLTRLLQKLAGQAASPRAAAWSRALLERGERAEGPAHVRSAPDIGVRVR